MRRADAHYVDLTRVEHRAGRVILMPDPPPLGKIRHAVRGNVAARHQLGIVGERGQASRVGVGDTAGADDAKTNSGTRHALICSLLQRGLSNTIGCLWMIRFGWRSSAVGAWAGATWPVWRSCRTRRT